MSLKQPIVLIGVGEMGSVFARALLRQGHPVYPVTRQTPQSEIAAQLPNPEMVLVAVAEKDLHAVLEQIPSAWRDDIALLQNELLPRDWKQHQLLDPTVISVWFEKKKGRDSKVLLASPTYGPKAQLLVDSLATLEIPARVVDSEAELLFELVLKNVYIVTTNVSGLLTNGTVHELWRDHRELAVEVANEVMDIQASLTGAEPNRARVLEGMVKAFEADPDHKCMGRSAPERLRRAIHQADAAGLSVPRLREIQKAL